MIKPQQAAPLGRKGRVSSDNAWPLRNADGLTFAEAKRRRDQTPGNEAALKSELRF
jgi:hypothetical protein